MRIGKAHCLFLALVISFPWTFCKDSNKISNKILALCCFGQMMIIFSYKIIKPSKNAIYKIK